METTSSTLDELFAQRRKVADSALPHIHALSLFHPLDELPKIIEAKVMVSAFSPLLPNERDLDDIKSEGKISITSTVTCIKSLQYCPDFQPLTNVDYSVLLDRLTQRLAAGKLRTSDLPHGNPFTVGLLLPILKVMGAAPDSELVTKGLKFAEKAIKDGGVRIRSFPENGYVTFWILLGLETWEKNISSYKQVLNWSRTEFYRQISLFASGTDEKSDAFQLGYNFLIQYKYARTDLSDAVVKLALQTLFDAQLSRGVWEKKDPLFVYGQGGDAYCFSFELLNALLVTLEGDVDLIIDYEGNLNRAFNWAQRNCLLEKGYPVWRSGHRVDDTRPESWATAEIYLFLHLYRSLLSRRIQKVLLQRLRGTAKTNPNSASFARYYMPGVRLHAEEDQVERLDNLLKVRLLEPLKMSNGTYSLANNPLRSKRNRSGIFFGPPGTGKTTFVKAVAEYLGWPFVSLDPSDFAEDGFQLITNTTSKVFKKLLELEDVVILFDEMEELIRTRVGHEAGPFEQKFLTTSLLPKLQSLYDQANCVFFIATNFVESIDPAAKREARFDFQVQILPPSFEEKIRMVEFEWVGVPGDVLGEIKVDAHKEKLLWATRMEMLRLIKKLKASPVSARQILDRFSPLLLADPDDKRRYDEEGNLNRFNTAV